MILDEFCDALNPSMLKFQSAILKAGLSYAKATEALITMARHFEENIVAARGLSKSYVCLARLQGSIKWYYAPARVRHLALHSKKARVRKKNMRRIFKW